jgi:hypothetical protein
MPLHRIPPEILSEIISIVAYLDHNSGTRRKPNLCSLSLCAKFLHAAVEPHLYRSLNLIHEHDVLYFLRSVLPCPHLAQHVKLLEARDPYNEKEVNTSRNPQTSQDSQGQSQGQFPSYVDIPTFAFADPNAFCDNDLEAAVRRTIWRARLPGDMAYDWYLNFEQLKWNSAAALALLSLPNLQQACLGMRHKGAWGVPRILRQFETVATTGVPDENRWINSVFNQAVTFQDHPDIRLRLLPHLKSISLVPQYYEFIDHLPFSVSMLIPFLQLKTVHTFKIQHFTINELDLPNPAPRFQTKNLALGSINLRPADLRRFFECFLSLERLRIGYSFGSFSPSDLAYVLGPLKYQLKELHLFEESSLTSHYGRVNMDARSLTLRTTSSLTGFEELKVIDTAACNLIGFQPLHSNQVFQLSKILPSSIQQLTLRNCFNKIASHVLTLLQEPEFRTKFPNFESVRMVYNYGFINPITAEWAKEINPREGDALTLIEEGKKRGARVEVEEVNVFVPPEDLPRRNVI